MIQQNNMENEINLEKIHWLNAIESHKNMILQSKMNIILATEALKLCDEELAKFPMEEEKSEEDEE